MKKILFFLLFFLTLSLSNGFTLSSSVALASPYVLPYPSTMPGGINYKIHLVWEKVLEYWYFGDFGKYEYNLKESDKYLVEAKTLFEYQQYLLGYKALQKSDSYFSKTLPYLVQAQKHGKIITDKRQELRGAATKHMEVLEKMKIETPSTFVWSPEKIASSTLLLHKAIDTAIVIRKQNL